MLHLYNLIIITLYVTMQPSVYVFHRFYCCLRGNVFTESLPSTDLAVYITICTRFIQFTINHCPVNTFCSFTQPK
jgi:hypothetical protein